MANSAGRLVEVAPIPTPPTPLIGRQRELSRAKDLLWNPDVRLVSLLGLGGIGKTRLALEIASELDHGPGFVDGVHFVDLAPLADSNLVPATIARVVGVPDAASLSEALRDSDMLLVLDNLERVIAAAPVVAELLAAAPRLSVLATSRRSLHLRGEHQILLPPLEPADAVLLFEARARAVNPGFRVDEHTEDAVESICSRLDGLPLAIELAAARSNVLSPEAIRSRLGLTLLTGGPQDQPTRLRSVQAMVEWSFDDLDSAAQRCLRELSVFSGSCGLEATEAVCSGSESVIDALGVLCEHHLIIRHDVDSEPRFRLFETVREFAHRLLLGDPQSDLVYTRHVEFYVAMARVAEREIAGANQVRWLDRIELEHDNVRAALAWTLEHAPGRALELSGLLGRFWLLRGYTTEGLDWLERTLAATDDASPSRALALIGAGSLLEAVGDDSGAESRYREAFVIWSAQGDRLGTANAARSLGNAYLGQARYDESTTWYQRSRELGEELGDRFVVAAATFSLGNVAYFQGDLAHAEKRWTESTSYFREVGDASRLTSILNNLAELAAFRGEHARGVHLHEEVLELRRSLGDRIAGAQTMINLGRCVQLTGDLAGARGILDQALAELRRLGIRRDIGACVYNLALVARAEQRIEEATEFLAESLTIKAASGEQFDVAQGLELMAALAADRGLGEPATRLLGASTALRERIGARPFADEPDAAGIIETVRAAAGFDALAAGEAEGRTWTVSQALQAAGKIAAALSTPVGSRPDASRLPTPAADRLGLTVRELEVLGYLAQRYTDREIAAALVISLRTVTTHVGRILTKLGADGRRQAAAEAQRLGLLAS